MITLSICDCPKLYGKNAKELMGLVMKKLALLPTAMLPTSWLSCIAAAPFSVSALSACSGLIFNLIQANENTKFILPEGLDPGL